MTGHPDETSPAADQALPLAPDEVELHESDPFDGDPETGSTKPDPSIDDTGAPPAGDDPMGGPAPSG